MKIFQRPDFVDRMYGLVPGLARFAEDAQETALGISDESLLVCDDDPTARRQLINFAKAINATADLILKPNK